MDQATRTKQDCILLVDDHPVALTMLQMVLKDSGYKIVTANNGFEALEAAKNHDPSLILLDIMMPDLDGFEVCERLKADPETANSAVIFLSAVDDSDVKVKGFKVGAVDYINKPFSGPEVLARVETHLRTKRLEIRLAQKNHALVAQNQRILESINEGIIGLDRNGLVILINEAAEKMTGFTDQSLIDSSIKKLFSADEHKTITQLIENENEISFEHTEIYKKNSVKLPVSLSWTRVRQENSDIHIVLVFKDISERLAAEEALETAAEELKDNRERLAHIERLSTMGEMAAGFAHEVNQPLTAISNYSRVCVRLADQISPRPEKLVTALEKMEKQSLRASDVIQRLRDFVKRPEDGRDHLNPNDLILDIVQLAEVDSRNNGVQIHMDLNASDDTIFVDPIQIQQVALNLIRNGLEAMSGSQYVSDGLWVTSNNTGNKVLVEITDKGCGLAPNAEDELFNPFYTTKKNGMGIGLSVCKTIINDHKGEIGFRRNDRGTTFWFELPLSQEG